MEECVPVYWEGFYRKNASVSVGVRQSERLGTDQESRKGFSGRICPLRGPGAKLLNPTRGPIRTPSRCGPPLDGGRVHSR